jgi:hypothetical protein
LLLTVFVAYDNGWYHSTSPSQANISVTEEILHLTSYLARTPPRGLHWVYLDKDGTWRRLDPPDDWGVPEDWDGAPPLAEQFFLSAPEAAWSSFEDKPWQKGSLKSEPDLYAKIASIGVSPGSILTYANRYGLLGPTVELRRTDKMLWPEYLSEPGFDFSDGVSFCAEPAFRWLGLGSRLTHLITKMEKIGNDPKLKQAALVSWCNMNTERCLDVRVELDSATGRLKEELVASSLAEMLNLQLLSAAVADVKHRRCEQCQTLFPVHPGFGRPEKKFCSDACRMRAYRKRMGGH